MYKYLGFLYILILTGCTTITCDPYSQVSYCSGYVGTMDNLTLEETVKEYQYPSSPRELRDFSINRQWAMLSLYPDSDPVVGTDAAREVSRQFVKEQWKRWVKDKPRLQSVTPLVEGNVSLYKGKDDTDFRVRFHGSSVKLTLDHEF